MPSATNAPSLPAPAEHLRRRLLAWYDTHHRTLPWRPGHGERIDPYRIWISEIMLQQTTVAAVQPYFNAFIDRWPTVRDLAGADINDVLVAWQGLGYYARARNLHACAQRVCEEHDGAFPDTEGGLQTLPGIGPYTAAAIAAIAFARPAVPVDGNVLRVVSRLCAIAAPLPGSRTKIEQAAAGLRSTHRAGDLAQSLIELGATVCRPTSPKCELCPWRNDCRARGQNAVERFPVKAAKPERPTRFGVAFWVRRHDGMILLRRRPPKGLLGGMMEIPSTDWRGEPWTTDDAMQLAPIEAKWRPLAGRVHHVFTHFRLDLQVVAGNAFGRAPSNASWCPIDGLAEQALPSVMRKIVRHALAAEDA